MELEFFASCLSGLEHALADELKTLGVKRVRPLGGGVAFFCEPEKTYLACLWSRLASRITLVLGRVSAVDAELLYSEVSDIAWEKAISADAVFAVRASGVNESLRNTRFTALKVKDAIVDRLRERAKSLPQTGADAPKAAIDVRIRGDRATISLDFSGEALSRRSYLTDDDGDDAALSCSRAAGMLALAGWRFPLTHATFVDPVCRDGIVLVEAASIACDRACGLGRTRWGFRGWAGHDEQLWGTLVAQAESRFAAGLAHVVGCDALDAKDSAPPDLQRVRFAGASSSSPMISRARNHVRRAGLRQAVTVEIADASSVASLVGRIHAVGCAWEGSSSSMFVASDINATVRTDSPAHVRADEASYLAACSAAPGGSRFAVADGGEIAMRFDAEGTTRHAIGYGRVGGQIEVFDGLPSRGERIEIANLAGGAPHEVEVLERSSEQFAARLRKVFRERRRWAARKGIGCYRIYDSDLPGYAVAIDWYTGAGDARGNSYLHISEYAPPASVDADRAHRRFNDALVIAPIVCGVRPDHVFSKCRVREKGGGQYRNAGSRSYPTTIEEGGYLFEVDLASRLDTGLFLDHRTTRSLLGANAKGARFLNLFAYTGTASVYAAGGGAASTVTVDLSQTYLDWARRNMVANGFAGENHVFERADAIRWITEARRANKHFDLVFADPPTFSNSKAMGKRTWDVQRDHVELLIGVTRLLSADGIAIFSCNLRSFKPDIARLERYGVRIEDISTETIPHDFARTPKIHKCYRVSRLSARKNR